MDFVTGLKALLTILAGFFGVLGLIKDFKDKKGRVTRWGRISLGGILLSSGLGLVIQFKESYEANRAKTDATARALALAQKTDLAVSEIQRGLSPIGEPAFYVGFSLTCSNSRYEDFCKTLASRRGTYGSDPRKSWVGFPPGEEPEVFMLVKFFADPKEAQSYIETLKGEPNISVALEGSSHDGSLINDLLDSGGVGMYLQHPEVSRFISDGQLKSTLDLPGVTVVLRIVRFSIDGLTPTRFDLVLKNGQEFDGSYTG
jgi:hypothetical protein